jgi:hypothetical protein
LGPISAEIDGRRSVAVAITTGLVLAGIPDIIDADGAHEIELRPADVDISAILDQLQRKAFGEQPCIWIIEV